MIDCRVAQRFERDAIDPNWLHSTRDLAGAFFEQNLVYRITREGDTFSVYSRDELRTLEDHQGPVTLKIEGIERLNRPLYEQCKLLGESFGHDGPVTCHLFAAAQLSPSFKTHVDPDDVVLHVVEGEKFLQVSDVMHTLPAGSWFFIPRNTPHRAVNLHGSRMLSFGLERFLVDKL